MTLLRSCLLAAASATAFFFAKRLEPLELDRRAEQHAMRWLADREPSRMRADTGFHRDFTRHYLTEKRSCLITLQILL
jgi:hypothetical protein